MINEIFLENENEDNYVLMKKNDLKTFTRTAGAFSKSNFAHVENQNDILDNKYWEENLEKLLSDKYNVIYEIFDDDFVSNIEFGSEQDTVKEEVKVDGELSKYVINGFSEKITKVLDLLKEEKKYRPNEHIVILDNYIDFTTKVKANLEKSKNINKNELLKLNKIFKIFNK